MRGALPIRKCTFFAFLLSIGTLLVSPLAAQIHGVPASATFPAGFNGFRGNFPPGIPASATSLGPNGFTPNLPFFNNQLHINNFDGRRFRHDHLGRHAQPFFIPLIYSPVYYDMTSLPGDVSTNASYPAQVQQSGDPAPSKLEITIVDKRSDSVRSEASAGNAVPTQPAPVASSPAPEELTAKVLVMRDGSKKEIRNYAIVGKNIFDLSDGRSRRIPLDDVDLAATTKVNEANGVDFKLR